MYSFHRGNTDMMKYFVLFYVCVVIGFMDWPEKGYMYIYISIWKVSKCAFASDRVWLSWVTVDRTLKSNCWLTPKLFSWLQVWFSLVRFYMCYWCLCVCMDVFVCAFVFMHSCVCACILVCVWERWIQLLQSAWDSKKKDIFNRHWNV